MHDFLGGIGLSRLAGFDLSRGGKVEYRIRVDEAVRSGRIRAWKRSPRYLLIVIAVLSIFGVINRNLHDVWTILVFALLMSVVAILGGIFLGLRRARREIESYRLIIEDGTMTRKQSGLTPAMIDSSDITRVDRNKDDVLLVYGGDAKLAFSIPKTLERFQEVTALLQEQVQIGVSKPSTGTRWLKAVSNICVALIPVFMFVRRSEIVFIAGIPLAAYFGFWIVTILRDRHTSKRTKWMITGVFVLIFAVVIVPGMIQAGRALFR